MLNYANSILKAGSLSFCYYNPLNLLPMVIDLVKRTIRTQQWKMIAVLLTFTAFAVMMVLTRVFFTRNLMYGFIIWNLFLAWIPYGLSLLPLLYHDKLNNLFLLIPLVGVWLLFFPNAPYIVTDLFHLMPRNGVPFWYDLMLLASSAWAGLMLGMVSLTNIQAIVAKKLGNVFAWSFSLIALVLCSFGVYLGRFERWNSWDLMTNPFQLGYDILSIFIHPFQHKEVYAITMIFSIFLIMGYLSLRIMTGLNQSKRGNIT